VPAQLGAATLSNPIQKRLFFMSNRFV